MEISPPIILLITSHCDELPPVDRLPDYAAHLSATFRGLISNYYLQLQRRRATDSAVGRHVGGSSGALAQGDSGTAWPRAYSVDSIAARCRQSQTVGQIVARQFCVLFFFFRFPLNFSYVSWIVLTAAVDDVTRQHKCVRLNRNQASKPVPGKRQKCRH